MTTELATTENTTAIQSAQMINFELSGVSGRKRIFNALNGAESLSQAGITTLAVDGIIIRPSARVDQVTGETIDCASVVFICGDKSYFSTSAGIVSSARSLMAALEGVFPEGETITLEFKDLELKGGRRMKYFIWA